MWNATRIAIYKNFEVAIASPPSNYMQRRLVKADVISGHFQFEEIALIAHNRWFFATRKAGSVAHVWSGFFSSACSAMSSFLRPLLAPHAVLAAGVHLTFMAKL